MGPDHRAALRRAGGPAAGSVLNDPVGMARAVTKLYLEHLPRAARPVSVITRSVDDVRAFLADHDGRAVLKPLQGSGGEGVFFVQPEDDVNLDQMVEALARDGYLAAQAVLPDADQGDDPALPDRRGAASKSTAPSPPSAGCRPRVRPAPTCGPGVALLPPEIDDDILHLVDLIRPQLQRTACSSWASTSWVAASWRSTCSPRAASAAPNSSTASTSPPPSSRRSRSGRPPADAALGQLRWGRSALLRGPRRR